MRKMILAAALFAVVSVPARSAILEDVVANVNGKPLMLSEFRKNFDAVFNQYRRGVPGLGKNEKALKEIRTKVLQQMVTDELLVQRAGELKISVHTREVDKGVEEVKRNFQIDPKTRRPLSEDEARKAFAAELKRENLTEAKFRGNIKRQIKIRQVIDREVGSKIELAAETRARETFDLLKSISQARSTGAAVGLVVGLDERSKATYVQFGMRLRDVHAERLTVSHILVKTSPKDSKKAALKALEKARALKKRLAGGENFFDLARSESDDQQSAARGGDLGPIVRGISLQPFENVAFALPVGKVSDPVKTVFGYHLILVRGKMAAKSIRYEPLKNDIQGFLKKIDMDQGLVKLMDRLRSKATIEYIRRKL